MLTPWYALMSLAEKKSLPVMHEEMYKVEDIANANTDCRNRGGEQEYHSKPRPKQKERRQIEKETQKRTTRALTITQNTH